MGTLFPRWTLPAAMFLAMATGIPFAVIAWARHTTSDKPRIHIIRDMDYQTVFKAQQENPLFADGRAMRPPVPGTVARGELGLDEHFLRGRSGDGWATTFPAQDDRGRPIQLDEAFFARGRERYEIFCGVCHGSSGYGDGMVAQRLVQLKTRDPKDTLGNAGWAPPASFHTDQVRDQPVGQLFGTVSFGKNNMAGYASQIPPRDRWAIVFYVKALQRSQHPE